MRREPQRGGRRGACINANVHKHSRATCDNGNRVVEQRSTVNSGAGGTKEEGRPQDRGGLHLMSNLPEPSAHCNPCKIYACLRATNAL